MDAEEAPDLSEQQVAARDTVAVHLDEELDTEPRSTATTSVLDNNKERERSNTNVTGVAKTRICIMSIAVPSISAAITATKSGTIPGSAEQRRATGCATETNNEGTASQRPTMGGSAAELTGIHVEIAIELCSNLFRTVIIL